MDHNEVLESVLPEDAVDYLKGKGKPRPSTSVSEHTTSTRRESTIGQPRTTMKVKRARTDDQFSEAAPESIVDQTAAPHLTLEQEGADSIHHDFYNRKAGRGPTALNHEPGKDIFDPVHSMASVRHEFGEHGGVNMSIESSSTFTVMEPETMAKIFEGKLGPDRDFYLYSRHFNPTVAALGRQLAALEGTEAAYCAASGMAAISSTLLQLCSAGEHIVASNRLYGGSHALLAEFLPRVSTISATLVDITDLAAVEAAIQPNTRVLYFESVSNPTLTVADIPALSAIAKRHGVQVVVDNTFSPVIISPVRHGADVVIHSITKFISGASDIIAGCVCGPLSLISALMDLHQGAFMLLGATMNPEVAFQIAGRLPHLGLRMKEHSQRALLFSRRLRSLGIPVIYPGLPSHPQHTLIQQLANPGSGHGGILCVDLGSTEQGNDFMRYLQNGSQFGYMAVSLGYSETLMSMSGSSTSSELTADAKEKAGISPGLVRISVGYTGQAEQRWAQLFEALLALRLVSKDAVWLD